MLEWLFSFSDGKRAAKKRKSVIDNAIDVIEQNGMKAHLYIAGVGRRDNYDLSVALDLLASSGFIITDEQENLVGKVITPRMSSDDLANVRRASFKVFSNSEPDSTTGQ